MRESALINVSSYSGLSVTSQPQECQVRRWMECNTNEIEITPPCGSVVLHLLLELEPPPNRLTSGKRLFKLWLMRRGEGAVGSLNPFITHIGPRDFLIGLQKTLFGLLSFYSSPSSSLSVSLSLVLVLSGETNGSHFLFPPVLNQVLLYPLLSGHRAII